MNGSFSQRPMPIYRATFLLAARENACAQIGKEEGLS
jgi:hypothetical protein